MAEGDYEFRPKPTVLGRAELDELTLRVAPSAEAVAKVGPGLSTGRKPQPSVQCTVCSSGTARGIPMEGPHTLLLPHLLTRLGAARHVACTCRASR